MLLLIWGTLYPPLPAAAGTGPGPGAGAATDPDLEASRRVEAERQAKEAYFRDDPWSPLRAFARHDFPAGVEATAMVGSRRDVDARLEGEGVAPRHLRITVLDPPGGGAPYRFRLENLAREGAVLVGDQPLGRPGDAGAERTVPEETRVTIGRFALRPYVQGGAGILILFDSRRTAGDRFVPPRHFPVDPAWRFHARLNRFEKPETVPLQTSLGRVKEYLRAGYFVLRVGGESIRVHAYQPLFVSGSEETLSILFNDLTNGGEFYGAGRYLDLDPPTEGLYTIDFNRAYNPYCNYTPVYNCPIPPRENRLRISIRAGEMAYPHEGTDHAEKTRTGF